MFLFMFVIASVKMPQAFISILAGTPENIMETGWAAQRVV